MGARLGLGSRRPGWRGEIPKRTLVIAAEENTTRFTEDGIFPDVGSGVTFVRDGDGRIATMMLPDGADLQYVYDGAGDLVQAIDGEGEVVEFHYDGEHRVEDYNILGEGSSMALTYGPDGRLEQSVDGGGVSINENSDVLNYEAVVVGPDPGLTTTTLFDADGLVVSVVQDFVDGEGAPQSYVTMTAYNAEYLLESRTVPTGATESWTYDGDGRVETHTDVAGVFREWEYGPNSQVAASYEGGEIVESTLFNAEDLPFEIYRGDGSLKRRATYTASGQMATMENGTGQVVQFSYDANDMIDLVTLPDFEGAPDVVDVNMSRRGQILDVTAQYPTGPGTRSFEYDANGKQTAIIDPHGQIMSFEFDELERLISYTDKLGRTVLYSYDDAGRELTKTNRNGEILTRTYDAAGRLATMTGRVNFSGAIGGAESYRISNFARYSARFAMEAPGIIFGGALLHWTVSSVPLMCFAAAVAFFPAETENDPSHPLVVLAAFLYMVGWCCDRL